MDAAAYRAWWEQSTSVPYGFCWCGCGQQTSPAAQGRTGKKQVKGEPLRFVPEHINRKMTEDRERQACRFYLSGETLTQVGERFGVSAQTVATLLKKHGVDARDNRLFSDEEERDICRLYASGKTGVEIARLYGRSHEVIYRVLKRHGVNHSAQLVEAERLAVAQKAEVCRRYLFGHAPRVISETMGVGLVSVNLALDVWQIGPQQDAPYVEQAKAISNGLGAPLGPRFYGPVTRAVEPWSEGLPSKRDEAALHDGLARYLGEHGFAVRTEAPMSGGGRCDIAADEAGDVQLIVEVKVADPLRGIGQLSLYGSGWHPKPSLALAVPCDGVDWPMLNIACFGAEVELWLVETDGSPHRLCDTSGVSYRLDAIPPAFEDSWILRLR